MPQNDWISITADEKRYIQGLGGWSASRLSKTELLKRYIEAAKKRVKWGRIDQNEAIAQARASLLMEG